MLQPEFVKTGKTSSQESERVNRPGSPDFDACLGTQPFVCHSERSPTIGFGGDDTVVAPIATSGRSRPGPLPVTSLVEPSANSAWTTIDWRHARTTLDDIEVEPNPKGLEATSLSSARIGEEVSRQAIARATRASRAPLQRSEA